MVNLKTKQGKYIWKNIKNECHTSKKIAEKLYGKSFGRAINYSCFLGAEEALGSLREKDIPDKSLSKDINRIIHKKIYDEKKKYS